MSYLFSDNQIFVVLTFRLFQENEAVRQLECGITRLLHMETVFVLSRYDDVTLDTLQKVMAFIAKEVNFFDQ